MKTLFHRQVDDPASERTNDQPKERTVFSFVKAAWRIARKPVLVAGATGAIAVSAVGFNPGSASADPATVVPANVQDLRDAIHADPSPKSTFTATRVTENGWYYSMLPSGGSVNIDGPACFDWSPDQSKNVHDLWGDPSIVVARHGPGWFRTQVMDGAHLYWEGVAGTIYWPYCPEYISMLMDTGDGNLPITQTTVPGAGGNTITVNVVNTNTNTATATNNNTNSQCQANNQSSACNTGTNQPAPAPAPTPNPQPTGTPTTVTGGPTVHCPLGADFFVAMFPGTLPSQWTVYPPNGAQYNGQPLSFTVPNQTVVTFGAAPNKTAGTPITNASSFTVFSLACDAPPLSAAPSNIIAFVPKTQQIWHEELAA